MDSLPVPPKFGKVIEQHVEPRARQPPKKENGRNRRGRLFSLITYASEKDIECVASIHAEQIRYWCYILHDKDLNEDGTIKEPHYHVLIDCYNANSESGVKKWFAWCKDKEGKHVNTLCEVGQDRCYLTDYLTHKNEADKYHYEEIEIARYSDMLMIAGVKPRNDQENALNIIDDMLLGATYYELCRHYGREFIINCSRYEDMIARMINDGSLPQYLSRDQKNLIYYRYRKDL